MAWNYFDYVDDSAIWLRDFVIATTLIRKSDTWAGENKFYIICMFNKEYDELYYLTFNDIEEFIKTSREIHIKLIKKEYPTYETYIAVAVMTEDKRHLYNDKNKRLNSINSFIKHFEEANEL